MTPIGAASTASHGAESSLPQLQLYCQQILEATADLSQLDLAPDTYYAEFLRRLQTGLSAPGVALWTCSDPARISLLAQHGLDRIDLGTGPDRERHDELLRRAFQRGQGQRVPPHSSLEGTPAAGNPTGFTLLLAPIVLDGAVAGLIEVWQDSGHLPAAQPLLVQFLERMARLAAVYSRGLQVRQLTGQQQVWLQMEAFARAVHTSLQPREVAERVANDGCRLIGCDRLSVGLRPRRRLTIEAVSSVEVVEERSRLIRSMARLGDTVLAWGDKLVYRGERDDTLPPDVLHALDDYLTESECQLLVVVPLRDEREGARPQRSVLFLECFEATAAPDALLARLDVVARHAAGALYNAVAYRRIPLSWLGQPLASLRDGWAGRRGVLAALLVLVGAAVVAALIALPWPLKLDARGQLLPEERCWIFTPVEAQVVRFEPGVQPGSRVVENQSLVLMYELSLELRLVQLTSEIAAAQEDVGALSRQQNSATTEAARARLAAEKRQHEFVRDRKLRELQALRERIHADEARPGYFWLKAPMAGTVLSWEFREHLAHRTVKPSEPLVRLGNKERRWEVELKLPHKHISQVVRAFAANDESAELDVDLLLTSAPARTFRGKLARNRLAGEALPAPDDPGGSGPVVLASVRIDGPDIPEEERVPPELLVAGTEIHAKVRCGDHALGYSLFHGVWEFVCEKVAFLWF